MKLGKTNQFVKTFVCEQVEIVGRNEDGPLPSFLPCESSVSEKENPDSKKIKLL